MNREESQDEKAFREYVVEAQQHMGGGVLLKITTEDIDTAKAQIVEDYSKYKMHEGQQVLEKKVAVSVLDSQSDPSSGVYFVEVV